jgi:hypothetical protein
LSNNCGRAAEAIKNREPSFSFPVGLVMQNELIARADQAIAESKRLIEELYEKRLRAEQQDQRLHYLHQLRLEDQKRK